MSSRPAMREVVLALFLSLCIPARLHAATYYVSEKLGHDDATGTSPDSCWKSLAKASQHAYAPGDSLLLRCNDRWQEPFICKGDGDPAHPVLLASYGTGRKPRIERMREDNSACVSVQAVSHWILRNLELSNAVYGIRLDSRGEKGKKGIAIEKCYFHDLKVAQEFPVKYQLPYYWGAAIQVGGDTESYPMNIDDICIRNCISQNCDGFYYPTQRAGGNNFGNTLIDGCTMKGHSANTVMFHGNIGTGTTRILRNCVFMNNGGQRHMPLGGTDVMTSYSENVIVEDCEFGNRKAFPGDPDGCAFDYEGPTKNGLVRRCDIHDCDAYALLYMDLPNVFNKCGMVDCLLRYNGLKKGKTEIANRSLSATGPIQGNTYYLAPGVTFLEKAAGSALSIEKNVAGAKAHVATPKADLGEGTYPKPPINVTLSCATAGAVIHYTTDGSYPKTSSPVYAGAVKIGETTALNAKAYKDGMEQSYSLSNIYVISDEH